MYGQKINPKISSNQIASALYHRLLNRDMSGMHTIKVAADGCGL